GGGGGFSYSDIMANLMGVFFGGGDCAEDIGEHLGGYLGQMPEMRVCSRDTLLRGIKELSCESTPVVNPDSGVSHQSNINEHLGDRMWGATRENGKLNPQRHDNRDR